MSEGDPGCIGLCDIDWEQELCLGCGRSTDEIYGTVAADNAAPPADEAAQ